MKVLIVLVCSIFQLIWSKVTEIPSDFSYLREIDPTILQDMRYGTFHNFVGRPISGYFGEECILTTKAAEALSRVQKKLLISGYSLKMYDCYRPQKAVRDFLMWSLDDSMAEMQEEFYSTTPKTDLFEKGYISNTSGHCRGSTMDLTIVRLPARPQERFHVGDQLQPCTNNYNQRFRDNSMNFGTGFDCFDLKANTANDTISEEEKTNREFLLEAMGKEGFVNYPLEWWHFTLRDEPYPSTPFNFDIYPIDVYRRYFPRERDSDRRKERPELL